MITDIQKELLRKIKSGEITKKDISNFTVVMTRIQEQIDKNMANLVWLAENMPEILMDEKTEIDDDALERYRRFKALVYTAGKLNPMTEFEKVGVSDALKKLSQLYPRFYFEAIWKSEKERGVT